MGSSHFPPGAANKLWLKNYQFRIRFAFYHAKSSWTALGKGVQLETFILPGANIWVNLKVK